MWINLNNDPIIEKKMVLCYLQEQMRELNQSEGRRPSGYPRSMVCLGGKQYYAADCVLEMGMISSVIEKMDHTSEIYQKIHNGTTNDGTKLVIPMDTLYYLISFIEKS